MKVMKTEEWLSNRTPANDFSVYGVRQPLAMVYQGPVPETGTFATC